jgi:hypothetical protein
MDVMTPKERWLAVMRREKPDRLPMNYWGKPEATLKLMQHLGCDNEWVSLSGCTLTGWCLSRPPTSGQFLSRVSTYTAAVIPLWARESGS